MKTSFSLIDALKSQLPIDEVAKQLDQLSHEDRLKQSRSIGPRYQKQLWQMCQERPTQIDHFVPPHLPPLTPVRHFGRNTLPLFKFFEKRFMRPDPQSVELWGYNEGKTRPFIGPGYFVCKATPNDVRGELVIDYTDLPPSTPPGWPPLKPNEAGLSRFVYAGMNDFMRQVSQHVTIGRAYIKGKESPNYFTLCRWDESE